MIYKYFTAGVNFQANSNLWNFKDSGILYLAAYDQKLKSRIWEITG